MSTDLIAPAATAAASPPPLSDPALVRECRSLCRYLTGQAPTDPVVAKYLDAHTRLESALRPSADRFDALLVRLARRGPLRAGLADGYASLFRRNATIKKKLVLTIALLEVTPPTNVLFEGVSRGGLLRAYARVALAGLGAAATLLVAVLVLGPFDLILRAARAR